MRRGLWAFALLAGLVLAGCDVWRSQPGPPPPPPTVWEQIAALGSSFLWWGGVVSVVGLAIRSVLWIGGLSIGAGILGPIVGVLARVPGVAGLATVASTGGACVAACGGAIVWLADRPWLVGLACLAAGLAWAFVHRVTLRRWLVAWQAVGKTPRP